MPRAVLHALLGLALVGAGCRSGTRLAQDDCRGFERYAQAQIDEIARKLGASDLSRPADVAALVALLDRYMNDAGTRWSAATDRVPFDCYLGAIGQFWLRLDELRIHVSTVGLAGEAPASGQARVAKLVEKLAADGTAPFVRCRTLLAAHCRH